MTGKHWQNLFAAEVSRGGRSVEFGYKWVPLKWTF